MPACIVVMAVLIFPLLYNIWISFHDVQLAHIGRKADFTALRNYTKVLRDPDFAASIKASFIYTLSSGVMTILWGLALALLLNKKFKGRALVRSLLLIPFIVPAISSTFVWRRMLDLTGILNSSLLSLNIISEPIAWLSQSPYPLLVVALFHVWRYSPLAMIMIMAQLQTVPGELYDAASIDGAGRWQSFRFVTIPHLKNLLVLILALRFIWTFNHFDDIYLMTGGASGTMVMPVLTYEYSFGQYRLGLGAANAIVLMLILVIFLALYYSVLKSKVDS